MAISGPRGEHARALVSTAHALAALALLGSALAASAQGPASPITPIPIAEVAQRAEQATTLLRSAQAPEASEFRDAERELTGAAGWIDKRHVSTTETLAQQRVEQIETMRATWVATQASAREAAAPSTVLESIDRMKRLTPSLNVVA